MLKILEPIKIKAKTTYVHDSEAFYHRIIGNYTLLESRISEEDLLHISTTPPEIYVSEGEGMTSILNRSERNVNNLQKVEVLNNVLNRIVVSADMNLTYQDRVFITDALYKLGIRDDRRFMSAFYRMVTETKNLYKLIDLYTQNGMNLRKMVESIEKSTVKEKKTESIQTENKSENHLFSRILERLESGEIYQTVTNFNKSLNENEVNSIEYNISGQSYTASHIKLSDLRFDAGVTENELVLFNSNFFEDNAEYDERSTTDVKNDITSAVLFDVLKNIYHTGFNKLSNHENTYFGFEDTFYKAADKIFIKLLDNTWLSQISSSNKEELAIVNNSLTKAEIALLEKADEGTISEEELTRLSEVVSSINLQNEKSFTDYENYIDIIRGRKAPSEEDGTGKGERAESESNLTLLDSFTQILEEDNSAKITEFVNSLGIINEEAKASYIDYIHNAIENEGLSEKTEVLNEGESISIEIDAKTVLNNLFESKPGIAKTGEEREPVDITYAVNAEESLDEQAEKISEFINMSIADNSVRKTEFNNFLEEIRKAEEKSKTASARAKTVEIEKIQRLIDVTTAIPEEEEEQLIIALEKSLKITSKKRKEEFERQFEEIRRIREERIGSGDKHAQKQPELEKLLLTERIKELGASPTEIQINELINSLNITNERKEEYISYLEALRKGETTPVETGDEIIAEASLEAELTLEAPEESVSSEDEIKRITEYVNAVNLQNEKRRVEYLKALERVERQMTSPDKTGGIERTRKDAILALKSPEELMKRLEENKEQARERKNLVMNEMIKLFPGRTSEVYRLINEYFSGNESLVQNNIIRPADLGELIYDINEASGESNAEQNVVTNTVENKTEVIETLKRLRSDELMQQQEKGNKKQALIYNQLQQLLPGQPEIINSIMNEYYGGDVNILQGEGARAASQIELINDLNEFAEAVEPAKVSTKKQSKEARELLEAIKRERQDSRQKTANQQSFEEPVETIFRQEQSISPEELSEQMNELRNNISRQISSEIRNETISEENVTNKRQIQTTETTNNQISAVDIQRMIESGVKKEMNTISNQVIGKLERQMRNEKVRRGYL